VHFYFIDQLALKIGTYVIKVENLLLQNFHAIFFLNPWEVVKVGSIEISFTTTHVGRFSAFWVNLLAFKFDTYVINFETIL